jgi:hypothetical protein
LLSVSITVAAQPGDWKTYSYPEDGFRVSLPVPPEVEKSSVPTNLGMIQLHNYTATDNDTALYSGESDFGTTGAASDADTLLQGGKNGALTNSKSHLVSEKKIMLGAYHGLEFEGEGDAYHISARIYMVGSILYQTVVISPIGKQYAGSARFLDSFQLIPRVDSEGKPIVAQAPEWKPYSYPADGFSAAYPSEPALQTKELPTAVGKLNLHSYLVQDADVALLVAVCDYGESASGKPADPILDGAQAGAISNVQAHLLSGEKVMLGDTPGRQYEAESSQLHFSGRIYLVGTVLYQILAAAPLGKTYPEMGRFLNSFQIIPRVAQ